MVCSKGTKIAVIVGSAAGQRRIDVIIVVLVALVFQISARQTVILNGEDLAAEECRTERWAHWARTYHHPR